MNNDFVYSNLIKCQHNIKSEHKIDEIIKLEETKQRFVVYLK